MLLPSRPLSIAEVLDVAMQLYQLTVRRAFPAALAWMALLAPLSLLGNRLMTGAQSAEAGVGRMFAAFLAFGLYFWGFLIASGVTVLLVGYLARGAELSVWRASWLSAKRSFGLLIITALLMMSVLGTFIFWMMLTALTGMALGPLAGNPLVLIAMLLITAIPATYLITPLMIAVCPLLLVGDSIGGALSRGFTLARKQWWRATSVLMTGSVVYYILMVQVPGAFYAVLGLMHLGGSEVDIESTGVNLVGTLIGTPFSALLLPMTGCFSIALFHDLLIRHEGSDLHQRWAQLNS